MWNIENNAVYDTISISSFYSAEIMEVYDYEWTEEII